MHSSHSERRSVGLVLMRTLYLSLLGCNEIRDMRSRAGIGLSEAAKMDKILNGIQLTDQQVNIEPKVKEIVKMPRTQSILDRNKEGKKEFYWLPDDTGQQMTHL